MNAGALPFGGRWYPSLARRGSPLLGQESLEWGVARVLALVPRLNQRGVSRWSRFAATLRTPCSHRVSGCRTKLTRARDRALSSEYQAFLYTSEVKYISNSSNRTGSLCPVTCSLTLMNNFDEESMHFYHDKYRSRLSRINCIYNKLSKTND